MIMIIIIALIMSGYAAPIYFMWPYFDEAIIVGTVINWIFWFLVFGTLSSTHQNTKLMIFAKFYIYTSVLIVIGFLFYETFSSVTLKEFGIMVLTFFGFACLIGLASFTTCLLEYWQEKSLHHGQ